MACFKSGSLCFLCCFRKLSDHEMFCLYYYTTLRTLFLPCFSLLVGKKEFPLFIPYHFSCGGPHGNSQTTKVGSLRSRFALYFWRGDIKIKYQKGTGKMSKS